VDGGRHQVSRFARRAAVAALALSLCGALAQGASAGTKERLDAARARVSALEAQIQEEQATLDSQRARVRRVQSELNSLAVTMTRTESKFGRIQQRAMALRGQLDARRKSYRRLQGRLDARARAAYEAGAVAQLDFLLDSGSLTDLSDRIEFVDSVSANDRDLADRVGREAARMRARQQHLDRTLEGQIISLNRLNARKGELAAKFELQQSLYDAQNATVMSLEGAKHELADLTARLEHRLAREDLARARRLARLASYSAAAGPYLPAASIATPSGPGPLFLCPVDGPHAYGDSFGAPRHAGGYHPHAGNDILAPTGTPVVAPFDGEVEKDPNGLGGNAIIERGAQGWIYGAHLVAYGQTGRVSAGTVIGYVGTSGDAQGGPPHLHFEWHPSAMPADPYQSSYGYRTIGTAVDPFPYLNEVC
jgi:murein DD-endopeptidase MepM/ murein hydrolase activator NlpD